MHIVLATGIYPPDIGGPATYSAHLAEELAKRGNKVTVITYGKERGVEKLAGDAQVVRVGLDGGTFLRWKRFSSALKKYATDADIVYAFSSVSCGMPLSLTRLSHPRKILRLGGDFLWERYTDRGGELGLKEWYEQGPWFQGAMNGLLRIFDHIVFSTQFQEQLYEKFYRLPIHSVVENALPSGTPVVHQVHTPFRLLFLGRLVAFKNLQSLIAAVHVLPDVTLTIVGSGPCEAALRAQVSDLHLGDRVMFKDPVKGEEKELVYREHDLLVLPSKTEISPNAALEARSVGLPVLLTEQTGLSRSFVDGALLRVLRTPQEIVAGIEEAMELYPQLSGRAANAAPERGWAEVCEDHLLLFRSLL